MSSRRAELYHSLSVMLESGVPLVRALRLASGSARGRLGRAFLELAEAAGRGEALADAMTVHPEVFAPLEVLVVEVAETSGRLGESLERLSQYYAFRDRIRRTATSGLVLPVVLLHIAALAIPLPPFVLGQTDLGHFLLAVAATLAFLYVPAAVIFAVVYFTPKTGTPRHLLDAVTLKVPVLGSAVKQLALSRYARAFHMLYACGTVPVEVCARKAGEAAGNHVVRKWLEGAVDAARAGNPVSEGFSPVVPLAFRQMWLIGEESGSVEETTARLADNAADESELHFRRLAVWLPRLIYVLVSIYIITHIFRGFAAIYGGYQDVLDGM